MFVFSIGNVISVQKNRAVFTNSYDHNLTDTCSISIQLLTYLTLYFDFLNFCFLCLSHYQIWLNPIDQAEPTSVITTTGLLFRVIKMRVQTLASNFRIILLKFLLQRDTGKTASNLSTSLRSIMIYLSPKSCPQNTNLPFVLLDPIVTVVPTLKLIGSYSIPLKNITPFSAILDVILSLVLLTILPN